MAMYRELRAWQLCHQVALATYEVSSTFPPGERYGLTSQARRAAYSAAANIAEGYAKRGRKEFGRFLNISLGSLAELEYILELARDLGYLTPDRWGQLEQQREHAGRIVWKLYRSLK